MENQIKVTTLPVIDYSILDQISEEVKEELAKVDIKSIVATTDTLQFLKELRAKFNKQFATFEDARKTIKKAVNEPYDLFNKAYEEKIVVQFKDADSTLKKSIDSVENSLKDARLTELVSYFSSLITEEINWITFEKVGLKITLSDSMKSLKSEIEKFVTQKLNDYNLIMTQPEATRILVRYKQTLDVSQAITSVANEIKQEQALLKAQEVVEQTQPHYPPESLDINVEKDIPQAPAQTVDNNQVLTSTFRVRGTKSQLLALKKYIEFSELTLLD